MQSCDPAPLSAKQRQRLTWEAATERLLDAAHIGTGEWPAALARLYDGLTWPLINVAVGARLLSSCPDAFSPHAACALGLNVCC